MKGALKLAALAFTVLCAQATDPTAAPDPTDAPGPTDAPAPDAGADDTDALAATAFATTAAGDWTMVLIVSINFDPAADADAAKTAAFSTGVVDAVRDHLPDGVTNSHIHFHFEEVVVAEAEPAADSHRRLSDTVYTVTVTIDGPTQCVVEAPAAAADDSHRRLSSSDTCLDVPSSANMDAAIEAAFATAGVEATVDVTHAGVTAPELESSAHLGASLSAAVMTVMLVASRG